MSVEKSFNPVITIAVPCITLHSPKQQGQALKNKLNLFSRSRYLTIHNMSLDFAPSAGPTLSSGTVFSFASRDGWISTAVQGITTEEIRGGRRQKQYDDVSGKLLLHLARDKIFRIDCLFVEYWKPQVLSVSIIELPSKFRGANILSIDR